MFLCNKVFRNREKVSQLPSSASIYEQRRWYQSYSLISCFMFYQFLYSQQDKSEFFILVIKMCLKVSLSSK